MAPSRSFTDKNDHLPDGCDGNIYKKDIAISLLNRVQHLFAGGW